MLIPVCSGMFSGSDLAHRESGMFDMLEILSRQIFDLIFEKIRRKSGGR